MTTTIFCSVCKRHVEFADDVAAEDAIERFRAFGHDDRKVPQLRHGAIGFYMRDLEVPAPALALSDTDGPDAPSDVAECFENVDHIDPERLAA